MNFNELRKPYGFRLVVLERLFSSIFPGSCENLLDHCRLCISIVLRVLPVLTSKLPLGALIQLTIGCVAAQPVAEEQHAIDLRAARREDMEIDVGVWPLEHTVLVPIWLSDAQHVADTFQ